MNLINDDYKKQLQALHEQPKMFNSGDKRLTSALKSFLTKYNPSTLLDFGCSKGLLIETISKNYPTIKSFGYDPGVPQYENLPTRTFDVVISTDVLEHVEPEMLEDTLSAISTLFENSCYLVIASYRAKKTLPDGRNAHLIIESFDWWKEKIERLIDGKIVEFNVVPVDKQPKKGPRIIGEEFLFVIEKNK